MYANLRNISAKLIQRFGQACVIRSAKSGEYDPLTGAVQTDIIEQKAHCLFDNLAFDFSRQSELATVKQGDVMIFLTEKADVNDIVVVGNEEWIVIKSQPIKPADLALLYQCQGRRNGNV